MIPLSATLLEGVVLAGIKIASGCRKIISLLGHISRSVKKVKKGGANAALRLLSLRCVGRV
jgi:hypothetical protein